MLKACGEALWDIFDFSWSLVSFSFSRPEDIKNHPVNMEPGTSTDAAIMAMPVAPNPDTLLPWDNLPGSVANRHNVRVLCDLAGLTLHSKNVITACIHEESNFETKVEGRVNSNGSHDWGICQFNDGTLHGVPLWIGPGAAFESVEEVLSNPQKCVELMINEYKAGHINWWMSFSTGAYRQYMPAV